MNPKNSKTPFAKKSFGQNFLTDPNYIGKIIDALAPQPGETIVEIGAGRGALTEKLAERAARIIAVELDRDLIPLLTQKFGETENFRLVSGDALKISFRELTNYAENHSKAKLVANLPYYISTAILQKLIAEREVFSEMILMFQREVVERITAEPGSRERGYLTVLVESSMRSEKLFDVPPQAFRPAPKVWSSVVRLTARMGIDDDFTGQELFREIISACFAQKRKTILNNLKNAPPGVRKKIGDPEGLLTDAGIDPQRRAETLTVEEWRRLLTVCL